MRKLRHKNSAEAINDNIKKEFNINPRNLKISFNGDSSDDNQDVYLSILFAQCIKNVYEYFLVNRKMLFTDRGNILLGNGGTVNSFHKYLNVRPLDKTKVKEKHITRFKFTYIKRDPEYNWWSNIPRYETKYEIYSNLNIYVNLQQFRNGDIPKYVKPFYKLITNMSKNSKKKLILSVYKSLFCDKTKYKRVKICINTFVRLFNFEVSGFTPKSYKVEDIKPISDFHDYRLSRINKALQ